MMKNVPEIRRKCLFFGYFLSDTTNTTKQTLDLQPQQEKKIQFRQVWPCLEDGFFWKIYDLAMQNPIPRPTGNGNVKNKKNHPDFKGFCLGFCHSSRAPFVNEIHNAIY